MLEAGQRVKLTDKAVRGLKKRSKNKIDWSIRRAIVVGAKNGNLIVKWDDRKTNEEAMPAVGFELVE